MTSVFVDTSAFLPLLNVTDPEHDEVRSAMRRSSELVTHNYVVVETEALVRRRLGATIAIRFLTDLPALAQVRWIDRDLHDRAVRRLAPRGRRRSLVDEVSFAFMRELGITTAIALDEDFAEESFRLLP